MIVYTWSQIAASLTQAGPNSVARIAVHHMQHPREAGIAQTFGAPYGQRTSYRALLTDGSSLCIEDFGAVYEARLEPPCRASAAGPPTTQSEIIVGLTALGALLGLAFGGKKEGALTGALLGGIAGLAAVSSEKRGVKNEVTGAQASEACEEVRV